MQRSRQRRQPARCNKAPIIEPQPRPAAIGETLEFGRFHFPLCRRQLFADGVPMAPGMCAFDLLLRTVQAEFAHVTRVTMMGELCASIIHEVLQPLAAINANADASRRWLAGDPPNLDKARACLERITRDGKRAGEVIARLRALVKKSPLTRTWLDLNETIREALAIIDFEVGHQQVAVRAALAAGLPPVQGDRVQLQQVVLNLVMNGIDAMKAVTDRPRQLLIKSQSHEAGKLLVAVQDSGVGVEPQNMGRLFEPFYTTKPDGMGMGLRISRSIIEGHGGRLWATANAGPGITMQFALPIGDRATASERADPMLPDC